MTMMKSKNLLLALLAAAFLFVTACGQKGPLYLPEDESAVSETGDADQQKEEEEGTESSTATE